MDPNPIPDDVRRFILTNGLTVPDLEALLVLRECAAAGLPAAALASRLYIPPDHTGRLREIKSTVILQPGPDALTDGLDQLAALVADWATEARKTPV